MLDTWTAARLKAVEALDAWKAACEAHASFDERWRLANAWGLALGAVARESLAHVKRQQAAANGQLPEEC